MPAIAEDDLNLEERRENDAYDGRQGFDRASWLQRFVQTYWLAALCVAVGAAMFLFRR